jgi:hypothetical protein
VAGAARRRAAWAAGVLVVVSLTAGCAPGTPDGDSWRIDAQRAVSDVASEVNAVELALRLHEQDRVFDRYLQTVCLDAEKGVGTASDGVASAQPPREERERYAAVTGQLDEAAGLVATTRIAVVDRETDRYDALADRLADAAEALGKLEDELQHPPAVSSGAG